MTIGIIEALRDYPRDDKGPWVLRFGAAGGNWNFEKDDELQDGSGFPGIDVVADGLFVFTDCWGIVDREAMARVFNLPSEMVAAAAPKAPIAGEVSLHDLALSVGLWIACRNGDQCVADAAMIFNQHPTVIVEAVGLDSYMFLSGDRDDFAKLIIEMDGE